MDFIKNGIENEPFTYLMILIAKMLLFFLNFNKNNYFCELLKF